MNPTGIKLVKAGFQDVEQIRQMQVEAFLPLLEKYQDHDTSPACESSDKIKWRMEQPGCYYYLLQWADQYAGAIRVVDYRDERPKRISPLFVLPFYQGQGFAQQAIRLVEQLHGKENWRLNTILQEQGNCYLYEKMGYRQTGETKVINDKLTLVFYRK